MCSISLFEILDGRQGEFCLIPTWDIERRANGVEDEDYIAPAMELHIQERARLAHILCEEPTGLSDEEIYERRV